MNQQADKIIKLAKNLVKHASEQSIDDQTAKVHLVGLNRLEDALKAHKPSKRTKLPLSRQQIEDKADKDGDLSFFAELELSELMVDVDCLNCAMSEWLTGGDDTCLEDISYRMVQVEKNGNLLMEVKGNVTNWLKENP